MQALENPMNKKMILLSESDVPLYSPHVTYLQLMMETRSRLNACKNEGVSAWPAASASDVWVRKHGLRDAEATRPAAAAEVLAASALLAFARSGCQHPWSRWSVLASGALHMAPVCAPQHPAAAAERHVFRTALQSPGARLKCCLELHQEPDRCMSSGAGSAGRPGYTHPQHPRQPATYCRPVLCTRTHTRAPHLCVETERRGAAAARAPREALDPPHGLPLPAPGALAQELPVVCGVPRPCGPHRQRPQCGPHLPQGVLPYPGRWLVGSLES